MNPVVPCDSSTTVVDVQGWVPIAGLMELLSTFSGLTVTPAEDLAADFEETYVDLDTKGGVPWECILLDLAQKLGLEVKLQGNRIELRRPQGPGAPIL